MSSVRRSVAERLVSFLLGAAWASALVGAALFFWSFTPFGLLIALMGGFVGSLPGLLFVVLLEIAALQFERQREMYHQTRLLKKIRESLERIEYAEEPGFRREEGDNASLRHH